MCGLPSARITLEMIIYKAKGNPDRPEKVVQKPFEGSDSPKILIRHKPFPVVRCPWHSTGSHPSSLPAPTFIRCEPQPLVRRRRRPRQPRLPHNTEASPLPCLNNMQPRRRRHIFSHPPLTTRQSQPSTTTRSRQLPESTPPTPLTPWESAHSLTRVNQDSRAAADVPDVPDGAASRLETSRACRRPTAAATNQPP